MLPATEFEIHHDLVQRSSKGDRAAFQRLYELYGGAMYGTALRILGNAQEAEDVLHDVFIDLHDKLGDFEGRSTFGYWLKRVVINKSLNVLKKVKKHQHTEEALESVVAESVPEEPWWKQFNIADIQQAMSQLAEGYRTVAVLFLFEEYSHDEIANSLGISVATSKSQLSRAKQKMRLILTEQRR